MEDKHIVAVEIGSSKIKGALAAVEPSGIVNLIAMREEPLTDSVRYGRIKNVEEVSKRIDAIRLSLENSKQIAPRKITGAYIGLGGLSVSSRITEVATSFPAEREISQSTINELKEKAAADAAADRDLYEVLPVEFVVDNMVTSNPVGTFATTIKARFIIISGVPGIRSNINRVLPERLKLDIKGFIVNAAAQADAVLTDNEKRLGVMFVDFGAETTTVAIYKNGVMQYLTTLPMGSRNITRDLMSLSYLEERAEDIKRINGVTPVDENAPRPTAADTLEQPEINNCIHARAAEIIANIIAQIEYAGMTAADLPDGIVIVGGGMRMKGFSHLLATRSKMKVRQGVTPRGVRVSDPSIISDDAVDIIALLLKAAKSDAIECLTAVETPEAAAAASATDDIRDRRDRRVYDDYEDDPFVRIGREDDDILEDEDEYKDSRRGRDDRRQHEARPKKPKGSSFYTKLRDRINNLMNDDSDRLDDDEN